MAKFSLNLKYNSNYDVTGREQTGSLWWYNECNIFTLCHLYRKKITIVPPFPSTAELLSYTEEMQWEYKQMEDISWVVL